MSGEDKVRTGLTIGVLTRMVDDRDLMLNSERAESAQLRRERNTLFYALIVLVFLWAIF